MGQKRNGKALNPEDRFEYKLWTKRNSLLDKREQLIKQLIHKLYEVNSYEIRMAPSYHVVRDLFFSTTDPFREGEYAIEEPNIGVCEECLSLSEVSQTTNGRFLCQSCLEEKDCSQIVDRLYVIEEQPIPVLVRNSDKKKNIEGKIVALAQQIATCELDCANIEDPIKLFSQNNIKPASLTTDNFTERNEILEQLTPDVKQWSLLDL